ncbi:MAG: hypothetical protein ACREDX_09140, partial [Aestuariivirga sp.]
MKTTRNPALVKYLPGVPRSVAALGIGFLCCVGAQAQQAPPSGQAQASAKDAVGVEKIVITATKRSESVQDVAVAVTAISGEQLEERGL